MRRLWMSYFDPLVTLLMPKFRRRIHRYLEIRDRIDALVGKGYSPNGNLNEEEEEELRDLFNEEILIESKLRDFAEEGNIT